MDRYHARRSGNPCSPRRSRSRPSSLVSRRPSKVTMGSWFSSTSEHQPVPEKREDERDSWPRSPQGGVVYEEMEKLARMTKGTRVRGPRADLKR